LPYTKTSLQTGSFAKWFASRRIIFSRSDLLPTAYACPGCRTGIADCLIDGLPIHQHHTRTHAIKLLLCAVLDEIVRNTHTPDLHRITVIIGELKDPAANPPLSCRPHGNDLSESLQHTVQNLLVKGTGEAQVMSLLQDRYPFGPEGCPAASTTKLPGLSRLSTAIHLPAYQACTSTGISTKG
jgi:hypothetical protein